MKKGFIIILCIAVVTGIVLSFALNMDGEPNKNIPGENEFGNYGKSLGSAASALADMKGIGADEDCFFERAEEPSDILGEIMGIEISKTYYNFKYYSYKESPLNYENPKEEAWNSLKEQIWKRLYAEKNNLLPSADDIAAYTKEVRNAYEGSEEGRILIKALYEGMGFTEDEYWEFYVRYYAPLALIDSNVRNHLEAQKGDVPAADDIEGKIIDIDYFEQLD